MRNFLDNKKQDFERINISFTLFPNIKLSSKDEVTRVITWCNGETEDIVAFHFIRSLDGIKRDIFYSCPECDNWFIHTSKREKIFCSNKCAARKVSRERRAKLKANDKKDGKYSAILKKGAERARKSYEKKVPQGKPARRPYKYKTKGE